MEGCDSLNATYKTEVGEGIVIAGRDGTAEVKGFERVFKVDACSDDGRGPEVRDSRGRRQARCVAAWTPARGRPGAP